MKKELKKRENKGATTVKGLNESNLSKYAFNQREEGIDW